MRTLLNRSSRRVLGSRLYSAPSKTTEVSLANIESRWASMSPSERSAITKHVEEAQLGDWKALTADQRKAAYYVAFGAHGPRAPVTKPGHGLKVVAGVAGVLGVSVGLMQLTRAGGKTPKTMSPEWREKSTEYMRSQNSNPISGISSENYSGKGM
ncbi:cytochrome c oxidase subunit V [Dichotomocladium elegans]|nr:cytochrome c oxidase subunit V [Dichotomocladium elegans]